MKFCAGCHSDPCICAKLGLKTCPECKRRVTMRGRRACVDCLPVPSFDEIVTRLYQQRKVALAGGHLVADVIVTHLLDFLGVEDDYNPAAVTIETTDDGDAKRLPTVKVSVPVESVELRGTIEDKCPSCPDYPGKCWDCGRQQVKQL